MSRRIVLFVLAIGFFAARRGAAQAVREFTVIQRDTSIKPAWAGFSFRGSNVGYERITDIAPGSPAERAGLKVGDEILSVNGYDRATRRDSARFLGPCKPVSMRVRRGETILNLTITPVPPPAKTPTPSAPATPTC